jgi:hypothetical protein
MIKIAALTIFFCACLMSPLLPAEEEESVLAAAGFEVEEESAWRVSFARHMRIKDGDTEKYQKIPTSDGDSSFAIDPETAFAGKHSLRTRINVIPGSFSIESKKIESHPGQRYEAGCWYKPDHAVAEGELRLSGRVIFMDENGKAVKYLFPVGDARAKDWSRFVFDFYPPVEAKAFYVTFWFSGKGAMNWDEISIRKVETKAVGQKYPDDCLLRSADGITLWNASPNRKVERDGMPTELPTGEMSLTLAGNESEPLQLVIFPEKDVPKVSLSFGQFVCEENGAVIAAKNFRYNPIGFIQIKEADNPALVGWNADPLLHEQVIDCKAGQNAPFWIMLYAPETALPGAYTGEIKVLSDNKELFSLPLKVRLRSFALPRTPSLKTFFYGRCQPSQMGQFDKRPEKEKADDIFSQLQQHRITGNQGMSPAAPKWEIVDGQLVITDWSAFDSQVEEYVGRFGIRIFRAPLLGFYGDNGGWYKWSKEKFFGVEMESDEGFKRLTAYTRQFGEHIRKKGWQEMFVSYIWDEPPQTYITLVSRLAKAVREGDPCIKIMLTRELTPELYGEMDLWCVPFGPGFVRLDEHASRVRHGDRIWYYNWSAYLDPANYIKNRIYPWLTYAGEGEGALLWAILYTNKDVNPWTEMNKTYGNGAATLLYPHPSGNGSYVSSQRFALMKEGIDDFDYLKILEEKIEGHCPGWGRRRVMEILSELVTKPPFDYVNDSSLLGMLRDRIGDEIEAIDQTPFALLNSTPAENAHTCLTRLELSGLCEPGAEINVNGGEVVIAETGWFNITLEMAVVGENIFEIVVRKNGMEKRLRRKYLLETDPSIAELALILDKLDRVGVATGEWRDSLQAARADNEYSAKDRQAVAELRELCYAKLCEVTLKSAKADAANPICKALYIRAEWARNKGFYEKAMAYVAEADRLDPQDGMTRNAVSIESCDYKGHWGFRLKNSVIEILVLETGGRIVDFRAGGVPCLRASESPKSFPEEVRAVLDRELMKKSQAGSYGGYEDACKIQLPESCVDWRLSFPEVTAEKITIAVEQVINDGRFLLRRDMTMRKDDPRLRIAYTITNLLPAGFMSDDPTAYHYYWRAHVEPGIGGGLPTGGDPEGDMIVVPTTEELPTTLFSIASGTFYEKPSVVLNDRYMGSFDGKEKTGMVHVFDKCFEHAYIWFHSGESKYGNTKVYTLEPFKGKISAGQVDGYLSAPFDIKPGQSVSFTNYLIGVSGVEEEDAFRAKCKEFTAGE